MPDYYVAAAAAITPGGRPCAPGETVSLDRWIAAPYVNWGDLVEQAAPEPAPPTSGTEPATSAAPARPVRKRARARKPVNKDS